MIGSTYKLVVYASATNSYETTLKTRSLPSFNVLCVNQHYKAVFIGNRSTLNHLFNTTTRNATAILLLASPKVPPPAPTSLDGKGAVAGDFPDSDWGNVGKGT